MRSANQQSENPRPVLRHAARRDWLEAAAAVAALIACLSLAIFLALIGSSRLLLFGVSVCAAIAIFEVAVIVTTRFRL